MATVLGQPIAQIFISLALFLFAFTTLVGNFYYAEVNFRFLLRNIKLEQWMLTASASWQLPGLLRCAAEVRGRVELG